MVSELKKNVKTESENALYQEIRKFSEQLKSYIKPTQMMKVYQIRRRSERLFAYHSIIRDACYMCFRSTSPSIDGKKCVVWGFDGRLWVVVSAGVFRDAVGEALIAASGAGDFVVKGDWVEKQSALMLSAYAGVCASPLDSNPSVVGFANGVWDFSNVSFPVKHDFKDRLPVTGLLPYGYDPQAKCPLWCSFLRMMLPNRNDVRKLQKYLGLGVVNRRMMGHVVEDTLWLVGSGANGKTTILNIVRAVYGYDKVSEASMGELLDRNQDARMRAVNRIEGHVFNICGEVDVQDMTKGSDAFKKLCSGEPHDARGIGKDIHTAYDIPFLIFSMNQRPANRRMDAALRRRIVEVRFGVCVRQEDMDASLGKRLLEELPGIRNWMIEGYKMLVADNYQFSHTSDDDYQEANGQYFDIFIRHEGLRPSAWAGKDEKMRLVNASVLLDEYAKFCKKNLYGTEPPSAKSMSQDLKRLMFDSVRKPSGVYYRMYCDREHPYLV